MLAATMNPTIATATAGSPIGYAFALDLQALWVIANVHGS
jgi:hypothetical protein